MLHVLPLQVIIQGFRSYRDQTIIEPFSPKHNIIGRYCYLLVPAMVRSVADLESCYCFIIFAAVIVWGRHCATSVSAACFIVALKDNELFMWDLTRAGIWLIMFSLQCLVTVFLLSLVGRNGSGKSNFFFGESCILVTCTLYMYSSACTSNRADLHSNASLVWGKLWYIFNANNFWLKMQCTLKYVLHAITQIWKSSC